MSMHQLLPDLRRALSESDGAGIRIAIIDSGVETTHPDLAGLALADDLAVTSDGLQLAIEAGGGIDVFGHGTAIASIIRRVAPGAAIGSVRVLNERLASRSAVIRAGVREAIARGYHILHCSFGCRGDAKYVMPYKEWIDEAYLHGIHVVAACNNFDFTVPEWPGHFPSVIAVNMARHEGDDLFHVPGTLVEFAAAGENIDVPWSEGSRKVVTGSSYAAPLVAGLLARVLSVHPGLTPLEAKAALLHLAAPLPQGAGAGNVLRPVRAPGPQRVA